LDDIRLDTEVLSVTSNSEGKLIVRYDTGEEEYDKIVMATHSDTTLKILGEGATLLEKQILGSILYQNNEIYIHDG